MGAPEWGGLSVRPPPYTRVMGSERGADTRFEVVSDFQPAGDQPTAIAGLAEGVTAGERYQTLLGITGSGKSATIAWTIPATTFSTASQPISMGASRRSSISREN